MCWRPGSGRLPGVGAALSRGGEAEVVRSGARRRPGHLLPTPAAVPNRAPQPARGVVFLDLAEQVLERFRPDVLLTYGGNPVCLELMPGSGERVPVVFHLHNFCYSDRRGVRGRLGRALPLRVFAAVLSTTGRPGRDGDPVPGPARSGGRR